MTPTETSAILRQFNEWRLGDEDLQQPDAKQITAAIYAAIEMIERMKAYETALREIEWSNDTEWQADRARAALEKSK